MRWFHSFLWLSIFHCDYAPLFLRHSLRSSSVPNDWIEFPVLDSRTSLLTSVFFVCLVFCGSVSGLFLFSWGGHPQGYGGSQARGQIAAATVLDLRHICDLHPSSRQCQILKPLSEARDGICNLLVPGGFVSTVSRGELLLIHSPFQSWHLLTPQPAPNPLRPPWQPQVCAPYL